MTGNRDHSEDIQPTTDEPTQQLAGEPRHTESAVIDAHLIELMARFRERFTLD